MAGVIPKRVIEDIRFRNDIVDVVGEHLSLKRAGSGFKACCPFHKEKTPSFTVNQQRQIYHCFGCGAGGDVFTFIREIEGVDFMMAAEMLARRAGIHIEFEDRGGEPRSEIEMMYRIHEEATRFYRRCLSQIRAAEAARTYLSERELPAETLDAFLVGYAPERWDAITQWGHKHKFSDEHLEKAGLLVRSTGQNGQERVYDRFRNRIMFPIRDGQGRVVAFSGRTLESDPKAAKYVNSPETPIFQKSRVLYALDVARKPIVAGDPREAIVCEGQIDVIRCHQAGFHTAVACQGTAFTTDHARILKRYADCVVVVFDTDRAGQDAAVKTAALFTEAGLAVRVAALPEGQDPDSFIRAEGAEAFQAVLDQAKSAVAFQIDVLSGRQDVHSEVGAMRVSKAVLQTIARSPSGVQRAKLTETAAELLGVPAGDLRDDLDYVLRRRRREEPAHGAPAEEDDSRRQPQKMPREEVALCELLVQATDTPELIALVEQHLPLDRMSDPNCRAVAQAAIEASHAGCDVQEVLRDRTDPSDEIIRLAARVLSSPQRTLGNEFSPEEATKDLVLRIWRRAFDRERRELGRKARDGDRQAAVRCTELTEQLHRLKRWEDGQPIIKFEIAEGHHESTGLT